MDTTPDFDQWVAARGQSLLRLGYLLTGSRQDAEDIVADVLSRALPRWSRSCDGGDPGPDVRRRVVEENLSRSRRYRRRASPASARPDVERTPGIAIEAYDVLWRACRALPVDERTPIVLRFYEDLEPTEIADLTGVREGRVRSRLSRAMAALRAEVAEGAPHDFESRVRNTLAERAEDATLPFGLAMAARARLRRRRRTTAKAVAAATMGAAVAAAAFGIAVMGADSAGRPPAPDAPPSHFIVADLAPDVVTARDSMREVTWRGIRFVVPSHWQPGITTAWCAEGRDPAVVVPRIALPGEVGPDLACTPRKGYGVTVGAAADFAPVHDSGYVWQYDSQGDDAHAGHPDGAWVASWYDDDWVVTIATPDPGLTSRIAQSVRGEEVDANGCAASYDDVAVRTVPGPRGVGAALCRYSSQGDLESSQRLTYVEVDDALAAIAAAPDLPGGDSCIQEQGWWVTLTPAGESAYLARYGTQGAGSCQDGVESTAHEQERGPRGHVEITPALRTAFGLDDLPAG